MARTANGCFPRAIAEAAAFGDEVTEDMANGRRDLRDLPLVTIDGADARDFDDAVYAQRRKNGWRLVVAIADVSSYVKPGQALDREAGFRIIRGVDFLTGDETLLLEPWDRVSVRRLPWWELQRTVTLRGELFYPGRFSLERELRAMPGRIVGRTVDLDGKQGFTLTLQAREQHIRRSKATSNICTNQGLMVTAATIYMSLLGAEGLEHVAQACMENTERLVRSLEAVDGISIAFRGPRFHEAVVRLDRPVGPVLAALAEKEVLGGLDLSGEFPELGNAMLVCATETKSDGDIEAYTSALGDIMREARVA